MTRRIFMIVTAAVLVAVGGLLVLRSDLRAADEAAMATTSAPTTTVAPPTTSVVSTTAVPPSTTTTTTSLPPAVEIRTQVVLDDVAPEPHIPDDWDGGGVVTIAAGGADLASAPGDDPFMRIREGLVVAGRGISIDREWVQIFHMCDGVAWVRASQVAAMPPASAAMVGEGFNFANAVIVVDPGHGGPANTGAVGERGLVEKLLNVDIAVRLADMLRRPNSINWETGEILAGDAIPAAHSVIMTRVGDGEAADYEAGLDFRAALANEANAHAMVSIHNNAGWEIDIETPGSDVYYQSQAPLQDPSRRLATLLVEEFRRGFSQFGADWVGALQLGAKSRISPRDGVSQYYGVLKASRVPTVIAEGAYISNPTEAALLQTPEFQHAYAAAVYRALVRFVTTDEAGGAPSFDPEVWEGFAGRGGARPVCEIPAQP